MPGLAYFQPEMFEEQIAAHGINLLWEKVSRCACARTHTVPVRVSVTNESRVDCPLCKGTGVFRQAPVPVVGLINTASADPRFQAVYGDRSTGMARISLPAKHMPAELDRFTVLNSTRLLLDRFSIEDEHEPDEEFEFSLPYPVATRVAAAGAGLCLEDEAGNTTLSLGVESIYISDADLKIETDPVVEDTDFSVSVDGKINWLANGRRPPQGGFFAIRYFANPVYVVRVILHTHRDTRAIPSDCADFGVKTMISRVDCWLEDFGSPFAEG